MGWCWLHKVWLVCLNCLFLCAVAQATLTIHLQSPLRNNSAYAGYNYFVYGGAGAFGATDATKMTAEANSWYSYTWNKTVSDFSWESFTLKACPASSDQNCNGGVEWKAKNASGSYETVESKMTELFASETEVWFYTNLADSSYSISLMPPGSKIVWFKSPWGNKALPQMVFGTDTVLMYYSEDAKKCGWFYGALTPTMLANNTLKSAYFQRYHAPYMNDPAGGSVDLSAALSAADSIYVDGTAASLSATTKIGSLGTCFDRSRTLHVYSPWRTNSTIRDSALYISVGSNILSNPTQMSGEGEYKYWWHYDFSDSVATSNNWKQNNEWGAVVNFYSRQNQGEQFWSNSETKPYISDFFPKGVFETWVYTTSSGKMELLFAPLEEKVIRFMSPWSNMSPMMIVADDTIKMGPFSSDTCGWYQGVSYKHVDTWDVVFRQTFGFDFFSASGTTSGVPGDPISLDSVFDNQDLVWIQSIPLRFSSEFPGVLGECPTMKISALVVDWAGEGFPDSIDVDFGGIWGGNAYTKVVFDGKEYSECKGEHSPTFDGVVTGMIQDTLVNGVPARVDSLDYPWSECTAAHEIEKWFIPVEVAKDKNGKSYTNGVCRDIDLTLDEEGFWLADISEAHEDGGFFPIDDLEYLDSAKTVKNPKFDWNPAHMAGGKIHNYSFSMKISAQFNYVRGQYFEFRGDDDVWVFINNKLVVDIGGCHNPVERAVDLDTLGLEEGTQYPFLVFFSERNADGSNFKMRTSINLQTQKTYYTEQVPTADGTIQYNLKQMLVDESLSCDISSVAHVEVKDAQSIFVLKGGSLPSVGDTLTAGVNYGGITINETMSGFAIDTTAIVASRKLAPGSYVLNFYLATDPTQSSHIAFTVPEYPLPSVMFTDSLWNEINPDTVQLGEYAFIPYPVYVAASYMGIVCDSGCDGTLKFSTKDSLALTDADGAPMDSIVIKNGRAQIYVMGTAAVENGAFQLSGVAYENVLTWSKINLEKPPVPIPNGGYMFDRNGDGVADSLVLSYGEPIIEDVPDSVSWLFGDSTWHWSGRETVVEHRVLDSLIVFEGDSLLPFLFTGSTSNSVYSGSYTTLFHKAVTDSLTGATDTLEFRVTGKILDKMPPVITNAIVTPRSEDVYQLAIVFSEAIDSNSFGLDSIFEFKTWRNGLESSANVLPLSGTRRTARYEVIYSGRNGVLPSVGDSIRLAPHLLSDLSQNAAAENNRWVRIVGEQYIVVESTELFNMNEDNLPDVKDSAALIPYKVNVGLPYESAEQQIKLPGFLIRYDLNELNASSGASADSLYIKYEASFFTNLGVYVNSSKGEILCTDEIFGGDCTQNPGYVYLGWNMRSKTKRLMGTGAYVAKLKLKIGVLDGDSQKKEITRSWGIRRTGK